jgi:hypothetical protein
VLAHALNTKGLILIRTHHREEGLGLIKYALEFAMEHDLLDAAPGTIVSLRVTHDGKSRTVSLTLSSYI